MRLHLGEIDRRGRQADRLLDARDAHDRAARAELRARAALTSRRLCDALAVKESAEARIGIDEQVAPVLQAKLGVLARDHRPFGLIKDDLALRRVASDFDGRLIEMRVQGAAARCALLTE